MLHLTLDDRDIALDETAEFLWHRLAAQVTVEELAEAVAAEYGITPDEVRSDISEAVASLVEAGFVQERSRS
ncbi:PqqD family protein [Streptomyces sp. GbtcB6]|uniref:PqqD family protein n=1 Tax=Streptomyces sp. GbtcB6 TaxID=2824751 RepID=UPI001C3010C2|nr:PqqD family protein [Streptomyces sp. GbtcB6]